MGVNIDLHIYKVGDLLNEIEEWVTNEGGYREGALPVREWFTKVAPEFGVVEGDKFFVVWNDYYDDYNPASNFMSAVDEYYFPNRDNEEPPADKGYWDNFYANRYSTASEGANSGEVLAALFPEEFGYEGRFSDYE